MIESITITLPMPPSAVRPNGRAHWIAKARANKRCRALAKALCNEALGGMPSPRWGKATMLIDARFRTSRSMDPDNLIGSIKAYVDGIQDAGIVANDNQLWPLRPTIETRSKSPGLTITIKPE